MSRSETAKALPGWLFASGSRYGLLRAPLFPGFVTASLVRFHLESEGIEPSSSACKAVDLPLADDPLFKMKFVDDLDLAHEGFVQRIEVLGWDPPLGVNGRSYATNWIAI